MKVVTLTVCVPDDKQDDELLHDISERLDYTLGTDLVKTLLVPDEDDDPRCVCGVYRSEHRALGCQEGFQTPSQWEAWKRTNVYNQMEDDGRDYDTD